ncbi:hypothetical protein BDP27DRAFT_1433432 [Rhodocollybia butyracea]|uniref:Uncharacterized protein n=1 Tax=Rhodocollybia butyracea TaxID=206335 RepID=A0A9P5P9C1_9AGAR|nr:hypothetical protein BDP27DRAFT_1433432 [Rhodocollybia butyracea]
MRFTFAAATLLGCLLSTGICAANPISARRDLSSSSGEIVARSATEQITPARRGHPAVLAEPKVEGAVVKWLEKPGGVKLKFRVDPRAPRDVWYFVKAAQEAGKIAKGQVQFPTADKSHNLRAHKLNTGGARTRYDSNRVVYFTYTGPAYSTDPSKPANKTDPAQELWGYIPTTSSALRATLFDEKNETVFEG